MINNTRWSSTFFISVKHTQATNFMFQESGSPVNFECCASLTKLLLHCLEHIEEDSLIDQLEASPRLLWLVTSELVSSIYAVATADKSFDESTSLLSIWYEFWSQSNSDALDNVWALCPKQTESQPWRFFFFSLRNCNCTFLWTSIQNWLAILIPETWNLWLEYAFKK